MITQRIEELAYADIEDLVRRQVPEGRELDYKRDLPGRTDRDAKEFLADVSSFANASGGHLVFGVTTRKEEGQNTNIPDKMEGVGTINAEAEVLRLEQMIRDGIQPRLVSFQVKPLTAAEKPTVVVIHVPRSWNAPHVVGRMSPTFFSRTSTGKHPLDVTELRHAFAMSESVGERIRAFRDERIGRILAGETPAKVTPGATLVMHLIPVDAFSSGLTLDVALLRERADLVTPISGGGCHRVINFDGVLVYSDPVGMKGGYVQLGRTGVVEIVDTGLLRHYEEQGDGTTIPSEIFERHVIKAITTVLKEVRADKGTLPVLVFLSLLRCRGYRFLTPPPRLPPLSDRDHLLMPDVLFGDDEMTVDALLRPAFDLLWQAFGGVCCRHYDASGRWVGQP